MGFWVKVGEKFDEVQKAIRRIRSTRTQLQELNGRLDSAGKPVKTLSDSIIRKLTAIEEALYQTKSKSAEDMLNFTIRLNDKIYGLYGVAAAGNRVPSKQVREVFTDLSGKADIQLEKLKEILHSDLAALNKLIYERQVPMISVKEEAGNE